MTANQKSNSTNIDTKKLREVSSTLLNLLTQVLEVTVLTVDQDDVEKICADMLKLAEEMERLRETIKILNNLPDEPCPRCNPPMFPDAARKGDATGE